MFLHVFLTPFTHESRVLKECRVFVNCGWNDSIKVAALWEDGLMEEERIDDLLTVWRVTLRTRHLAKNLVVQTIKYIEWMIRISMWARPQRLTIVQAHSLSALPVCIFIKWLTGAPVVYDAHELESETAGLSSFRRRVSRWAEGLFIRWADRTIVVSDSIADWYADAYGIERPTIVRNVPEKSFSLLSGPGVLRHKHDIRDDEILFLYQGILSPGRGIERLLDVFAGMDGSRHIVFMGYGVLRDQIVESTSHSDNIHYEPAVPPDEVLHYTSSADVGLCLIENTCLSYYYSLPNKLFEYLLSGLPIVVNDMPEQRGIVERYECGWVAPESTQELVELISSIGPGELGKKRDGVERARGNLSWENEAVVLQQVYEDVRGSRPSNRCARKSA